MRINEINENMSHTAKRIHDIERKKKVQPGTEEWFKLWFSLPYLKEGAEVLLDGYKMQLERGSDMDVLHIVDTKTGKRTEVRGKPNYEITNDPDDPLHQLLDKIGKASNISELINGEPVGINPNHPDGAKAKVDVDKAFNENVPSTGTNRPGSIAQQINWGGKNQTTKPKAKQPNQNQQQLSWWQTLKQRVMGENFADGKKKGKSRPGRVKRAGASCDGSVTELRRKAKNSSGEKAKMYHWCANMKGGKKK